MVLNNSPEQVLRITCQKYFLLNMEKSPENVAFLKCQISISQKRERIFFHTIHGLRKNFF